MTHLFAAIVISLTLIAGLAGTANAAEFSANDFFTPIQINGR